MSLCRSVYYYYFYIIIIIVIIIMFYKYVVLSVRFHCFAYHCVIICNRIAWLVFVRLFSAFEFD